MSNFPRMLYRAPGAIKLHDVMVEHVIVANESEADEAAAHGWRRTPAAAHEAYLSSDGIDAVEPPTRAEFEQKARELQIKFDGRTSDRRLGEMIAAAASA